MADYKITPEDVQEWGKGGLDMNFAFHWLADILNGDYDVKEARSDCLSIITPKSSPVRKKGHCMDCGKRLTEEEIKYLEHTCSNCESKTWDKVLHEKTTA
jgi:DNA-directed RNA polymerase subunit RPC12/RpoP